MGSHVRTRIAGFETAFQSAPVLHIEAPAPLVVHFSNHVRVCVALEVGGSPHMRWSGWHNAVHCTDAGVAFNPTSSAHHTLPSRPHSILRAYQPNIVGVHSSCGGGVPLVCIRARACELWRTRQITGSELLFAAVAVTHYSQYSTNQWPSLQITFDCVDTLSRHGKSAASAQRGEDVAMSCFVCRSS